MVNDSNRTTSDLETTTLKLQRMRYRVYAAVLILLTGVFVYFFGIVLNVMAVPVGIIVWTTVIVFILKGPVNYLAKKGISRGFGTFVSFFLFIIILLLLLALIASPVFGMSDQFNNLLNNASHYITVIRDWINDTYNQYAYLLQDQQVKDWINDALSNIGNWASSMASQSAQGVVAIGSGVGTTFMVVGFAFVIAYWCLLQLPQIGQEIRRLFGPKYAEDLKVIHTVCTDVMGGYIKGTVIQCVLIGILCGIGFAVMGVPSAAALGLITGLLNIIPVIGPWFGGALAAIVGFFVSPWIALIALIYTIVVQQIIYTFVSPKVLGDSVNIHPALIILGLVIGSAVGTAMSGLMGAFVGALISIPIIAVVKSLFVYYFERATGRTIVAPDGIIFKGEPINPVEAHPAADATGEFHLPKESRKQKHHFMHKHGHDAKSSETTSSHHEDSQ